MSAPVMRVGCNFSIGRRSKASRAPARMTPKGVVKAAGQGYNVREPDLTDR